MFSQDEAITHASLRAEASHAADDESTQHGRQLDASRSGTLARWRAGVQTLYCVYRPRRAKVALARSLVKTGLDGGVLERVDPLLTRPYTCRFSTKSQISPRARIVIENG